MSRRRYLSTDISTDPRIAELSEHGALPVLLYTWAIAHADDWGRMTGDPRQFRLLVCPGFDVTAKDVDVALTQVADAGLWLRYAIGGRGYIAFPPATWFKYQTYVGRDKRRADASQIPAPTDPAYHITPENAEPSDGSDAFERATPTIAEERRGSPQTTVSPSPSPSPSLSSTISSASLDSSPSTRVRTADVLSGVTAGRGEAETTLRSSPAVLSGPPGADVAETAETTSSLQAMPAPVAPSAGRARASPRPNGPANAAESEGMQLARFLAEQLQRNAPEVRLPPTLTGWATEFERALHSDGRTVQDLRDVIAFALHDPFWAANIHSAKAVRKQFATLAMRRRQQLAREEQTHDPIHASGHHGRSVATANGSPGGGTRQLARAAAGPRRTWSAAEWAAEAERTERLYHSPAADTAD